MRYCDVSNGKVACEPVGASMDDVRGCVVHGGIRATSAWGLDDPVDDVTPPAIILKSPHSVGRIERRHIDYI